MYLKSVFFVGALVYGFITTLMIIQLFKIAVGWVNDSDKIFIPIKGTERVVKWVSADWDSPCQALAKTYPLAYAVAVPVVLLWVIAALVSTIIGCLFAIRGFIRMRKKGGGENERKH